MDPYAQKKLIPQLGTFITGWSGLLWNLPFDFVERELTVANTKLLLICSKTFINYIELTHEAIEKK